MLTDAANRRLTETSQGTPMGTLLRCYWHPIAAVGELEQEPVKAVRLLGEDLVLFRTEEDAYGLIDERCPHRGASLSYGFPDGGGLRCPYHGWQFNPSGQCLDQPNESGDSSFKHRVQIRSYPVAALGGLIFAYLGSPPVPCLPKWDLLVKPDCYRLIATAVIPCNWLQIMENSLDPVHFEWLHGRYFDDWLSRHQQPTGAYPGHHVKIDFSRFPYGMIKRRLLAGKSEESDDWRIGHPVIFPCMLKEGGDGRFSFQIRVPMDDTTTWHLWYMCYRPHDRPVPVQSSIPIYEIPIRDAKGRYLTDNIAGQDVMVWATQGRIADRTKEKLGTTDRGIILFRQLLQEQLARVADGQDPINVFRDPSLAQEILLPQEHQKFGEPVSIEALLRTHLKHSPELQTVIELFSAQ